MEKKTIRVVCALIIKNGKLYIAERDYGEFKGLFEFPGGKVEPNETKEEAIIREIKEELNADIKVEGFLFNERYEYSSFILDMDCFKCSLLSKELEIEKGIHADQKWISKEQGSLLKWCPADKEVFERAKSLI